MNVRRVARRLCWALLASAILCSTGAITPVVHSQAPRSVSPAVPGRYLVIFHESAASGSAQILRAGARLTGRYSPSGIAGVRLSPSEASTLRSDPAVEQVVPDRVVFAHALLGRALQDSGRELTRASTLAARPPHSVLQNTVGLPPAGNALGADTFYKDSPQGWAVRASGGYGSGFLGGTTPGPWNRTLGAGVRIAVLDSGVDSSHPDIAPNLALNLSEIDTVAQRSPCDDGSPQDQQGHGTWVASLAAGAMGRETGRTVGVAPSATLLNIKVLQRIPGTGATLAARCAAGQAAGLASWLFQGIDDAIAQHADVIVLSLGSLVDLYTGEGAGLKAAFDHATNAASKAGVLIVAAAGNDAFDLNDPRYVELPAQSRGVLAVVASTNPACMQNNQSGAICLAGPVSLPYYSNYGATLHAIAAPGGNYPVGGDEAVSGWIRGACSSGQPGTTDGMPGDSRHSLGCFNLGHQRYLQAMGTSASAGLAAGAAALLRAAHPGWTPAQTAEALRSTATKIGRDDAVLLDLAGAIDAQP